MAIVIIGASLTNELLAVPDIDVVERAYRDRTGAMATMAQRERPPFLRRIWHGCLLDFGFVYEAFSE